MLIKFPAFVWQTGILRRCRQYFDAYGSKRSETALVLQVVQYPGSVVSDPGGPGGGIGVQHKSIFCVIGDSAMLVQRRSEKGKEFLLKFFQKFDVLYKRADNASISFQ